MSAETSYAAHCPNDQPSHKLRPDPFAHSKQDAQRAAHIADTELNASHAASAIVSIEVTRKGIAETSDRNVSAFLA